MASGILSDWYFITFFNEKITIVTDFSKKSKDEKIYCVYIRFVLHLNDKQLKNTITMKKLFYYLLYVLPQIISLRRLLIRIN